MTVETWADILSIVAGVILGLGVIGGGIWRIYIHKQRRGKFPKANLSQKVQAIKLTDDKVCIHTSVRIQNIGDVMLSLCLATNIVHQIRPLDDLILKGLEGQEKLYDDLSKEIRWTALDSKVVDWGQKQIEIEPGEEDTVHFDSVIPAGIEVVQVYTYFQNVRKRGRDIGWHTEQFYDVSELLSGGEKGCHERK